MGIVTPYVVVGVAVHLPSLVLVTPGAVFIIRIFRTYDCIYLLLCLSV